jgi:hypothetical protein
MGIFNLPKEDLYTGQDSAEERKPRFELDEEGPESEEMKSKKEEEIDLSLPPGTEHLDDILDEID